MITAILLKYYKYPQIYREREILAVIARYISSYYHCSLTIDKISSGTIAITAIHMKNVANTNSNAKYQTVTIIHQLQP